MTELCTLTPHTQIVEGVEHTNYNVPHDLRYLSIDLWNWLVDNGWYEGSPKPETEESKAVGELAKHLFTAFEIMYENGHLPREIRHMACRLRYHSS